MPPTLLSRCAALALVLLITLGTSVVGPTPAHAAGPSSHADLAELRLSSGALSPAFNPSTTSYTAEVGYSTDSVTVTATAADIYATARVNGAFAPSHRVALSVGNTVLTIITTAQDGTTKTVTVTITRKAPSNNADLTALHLVEGTLSPAFAASQTSYSATVPYVTHIVGIRATAATAAVTINGEAATMSYIGLSVGENTITIVARAQDGTTAKTTTVTVTREAPDLTLSGLTVSPGTLTPAFDPATTHYSLALPYAQSSVDFAAAATIPGWTLSIDGTARTHATISAPVGTRTVSITVSARDGEQRSYSVTITRAAPSSEAALRGLNLTEGTLSPAFTPSTMSYRAGVDYLTTETTLEALTADASASVTINGAAVTSAVLPLRVGANTVTIVTTAEDGTTTKTTTLTVTREAAPAPAAAIDVEFEKGDEATGASSRVSASQLLPGSAATLTMHSTPVVLASGTVLSDGTVALRAALPAGVEAGAHRLVFEGVARDGTPVARTAWFTVLLDGSIGAVSLLGPVAYVEPAVAAPPAGAARALPVTGADATAPAGLAGLLLALGAGMLLSRRWAASCTRS